MEIVAGIFWIVLGAFVVIKKGAAGLGGPPLVGTICAVLVLLGIIVCWKVIDATASVVCFISCIFLQFFLLFFALRDQKAAQLPLIACGYVIAPIALFGEIFSALANRSMNPWSVVCYLAWAAYDLWHWSEKKKKEQDRDEQEETHFDHHPSQEQPQPSCDKRIWINGKFADSGSHRSSREGGDES